MEEKNKQTYLINQFYCLTSESYKDDCGDLVWTLNGAVQPVFPSKMQFLSVG
jgi:hypothetical protein